MMYFTARICRLCEKYTVPVCLDNPATSMLWLAEPVMKLLIRPACQSINVDQCCFQSPWRKRTKLLFGCVPDVSRFNGCICASKKGICDYSGQPYIILQGSTGKQFKTRQAQEYPKAFARAIANILKEAIYEYETALISRCLS